MPRPVAGEPPASLPPSPYHTPPAGMPNPLAPVPFSYAGQPIPPAPAATGAPTPAGLMNAFRRRWVLGTLVGLLAAGAAAVGLWVVLPGGKHEARALVQLRPRTTLDVGVKSNEDYESYRKNQAFIMKTRDLITRTLADPAVASLETIKNADDPIRHVEEYITVSTPAPDILAVTMKGNNLEDMKTIVDALVKRYVDDATAFTRRMRTDERRQLEQLLETLKAEVDSLERQIKLLARSGIGGTNSGETASAVLHKRISELEAAVSVEKDRITRLEAQHKVAKQQLDAGTPPIDKILLEGAVEGDKRVQQLRLFRDEMKRIYDHDYKESPEPEKSDHIRELKAKLDKVEGELTAMRKTATKEIEDRDRILGLAALRTKLSQLDEQLAVAREIHDRNKLDADNLKKTVGGIGESQVELAAMLRGLYPQKEAIEKIQLKLVQMRMDEQLDHREKIRETAQSFPNANQSKKFIFSGVAGLGTFFATILLVAFLEWRTRRVDGVDQVVTELGMRIIGTVPAFPNRASLKAAAEAGGANWRFALNEAINSTRTMLLHAARNQSMQVVMVTSATQGEGKTSIASQLGTSMATAGMRTLIVDCDLRNPSIHKLFELTVSPGVSEVLIQDADVSDAIQPTAVPNLWVIPAGQCSNRVIAALAQGHAMETMFNRLRGQFDFIIVDSCPVLPVADALLIGQHVDGVLFAIMQDISQLPKVLLASEKLNQLNIPLVGAVVNGIRQDVYSYGYNYVKQLPA